jgi:hypothetical protein
MAFLNELPDTTNKSGFQLISNTEWQVVARNIESTPSNWSGDAFGSGKLNKGISNGSLSASSYSRGWAFSVGASNPILDSDPYFATSHSTSVDWNQQGLNPPLDSDQKRTHRLSNGQLIWDFSGNVFQWVSDARSELGIPVADEPFASVSTWHTFNNAGANRFSTTFNLIFGSLGISDLQHATEKNLGELFGGSGGLIARGGEKGYGESGLYATKLFPSGTGHQTVGFRCIYVD